MKGNQVGALLQHNFVLLGNIRELNLQNNMISSFFSNSFDGLDALLDLDMSGNKLEFLPKFGNLLDLEILNFSRNHLKEVNELFFFYFYYSLYNPSITFGMAFLARLEA